MSSIAQKNSHPYSLAGKTFIITGGGSGIGLNVANALLEQGSSVVVCDLDFSQLAPLDNRVHTVLGDITLPETAQSAIDRALESTGRIDGVVFAAGSSATGALGDLSLDEFGRDLSRNLTVHLSLSQAVLRHKAEFRTEEQCSLVYVASKQAVAPSSGFGGYPIAKGGVLQMARILAMEGAPYGIRANTVNPGAVFDGSKFWNEDLMQEKALHHNVSTEELPKFYANRTMLGVRVSPVDVSNAIMFLLSPLSRATTGSVIAVDGGLPVSFAR
ncbi:SDR family oxidoreductase [Streptomyces sp. NPDC127084]|uniref:SDR family oxidoreductase n=1 Tax=Streptomyces sp. NPDC127084 TaxID=3347133 RepID=UPI00364D95A2